MEKRIFLITGGASGMGLSTAKRVVKEGHAAVIVDINQDSLDKALTSLRDISAEANVMSVVADVSKEDDVIRYVSETVNKYGRIDGFFNNAGIDGPPTPLVDYPMDAFRKVIDIDLKGVFYGLKHVLRVMEKQGYGAIVSTASALGLLGSSTMAPYVASKHAVAGLTKSAAADFGGQGIRVNAVAPGAIRTPMVVEVFTRMNPEDPAQAEREFATNTPLRRFGEPEEVTDLVWYLFSDAASYINGQIIAIDGGQTEMYRELAI